MELVRQPLREVGNHSKNTSWERVRVCVINSNRFASGKGAWGAPFFWEGESWGILGESGGGLWASWAETYKNLKNIIN